MAYQGISPYLYRNNLTNVQLLDDISAGFNGTQTQFPLTANGAPFHAVSARSLLIVLGGIVQEPEIDYTVGNGVITFTTPPAASLTFAARNIYGLNRLTGVNDGVVTPAGLSQGGPEWDTSGNFTVDGDVTQLGETNNIYINTDTPTIRPTLDLNFERDQRLDSRVTFSRSSTATYLGSDGLIKTALANEPRFEFDTNGNCLGLLIEESRTNLVTSSTDLISSWTANETTTSSNIEVSPDNSITADSIIPTSTSNVIHRIFNIYSVSLSTTYTFSIFIKPFGYNKVFLRIGGQNSSPLVVWNISTKTIDFIAGTFISSSIQEYPNGWYRVSLTMNTNTSTYAPNIGAVSDLFTTNTSNEVIFTGDGNSGAYVWGAQLEAGSFPTSYIPTSGSTVTRSADNASITGTNFTEWYNASEGTVFVEDICQNPSNDWTNVVAFMGNDNNNRLLFFKNWAGVYNIFEVYSNGAQSVRLQYDANVGQTYKICNAYKLDDFASSVSGQIQTDTSAVVPTVNRLEFGSTASPLSFSVSYVGHIKQLIYYPQRLSNSQLQNLTS